MPTATRYSRLGSGAVSFADMLAKFGVVTVMNAKVYDSLYDVSATSLKSVDEVLALYEATSVTERCELKTLKIANITEEGPTKTITGGQSGNPLLKYGKTARLEIQDALGSNEALEAFGLVVNEYSESTYETPLAMHALDKFADRLCIIGDSFFLSEDGSQVPVKIIFYNVLPDSLFNLTQDAEGDATVFDLNGDLLKTTINIGVGGTTAQEWVAGNAFYSVVSGASASEEEEEEE